MIIAFNITAQNPQLQLWNAPPYKIKFNTTGPTTPSALPIPGGTGYWGQTETYASKISNFNPQCT